jgi:hypothetical protein
LELEWDDNYEVDLAGYRVWRALVPGGPFVALHLELLAGSEFSDLFAQTGHLYYYRITAVDLDGDESVPSSEVSARAGIRPWINELHYDNAGSDADEGFEIAGPAGLDLMGWEVQTYNGNGGALTTSLPLSGVLPDDGSGFGFVWFALPGVQNGSPDGLALVDPGGSLVEFLSYEGTFVAVAGAANGVLSSDIGVAESGTTPIGFSLQRIGNGSAAGDFSWAEPAAHTRGSVNGGQVLANAEPLPLLSTGALLTWLTVLAGSGASRARLAPPRHRRPPG